MKFSLVLTTLLSLCSCEFQQTKFVGQYAEKNSPANAEIHINGDSGSIYAYFGQHSKWPVMKEDLSVVKTPAGYDLKILSINKLFTLVKAPIEPNLYLCGECINYDENKLPAMWRQL